MSAWHPMETAPKDGTLILVCFRNNSHGPRRIWGRIHIARWNGHCWIFTMAGKYSQDKDIVGWRPVPEPPE